VIAQHSAGGLDVLGVEQAADDDATPVLPRSRVGPADLIGDAFAVRAETDVVDPAVAVKIFWGERVAHAD